uniref:Neurofibromin (Trinotate prediction) n=1 Tax=Henneguya salminicola TaxID=69463 RepID=A0A6G3MHV0_HENSL
MANTAANDHIWIVVMETICHIISKSDQLEGVTGKSTIKSYEKLVELSTYERDGDHFPVLSAILDVISTENIDNNLISAIIVVFTSKGKLRKLLKFIFKKEVENNDSHQTLFRSGSIPVSFLTCSLKMYGESFAKIITETLLNYICLDFSKSLNYYPS